MYLLTPPPVEPLTISAAKAALRLDDDRHDAVLPGLIAAARSVAEQETGRQLVQQTHRAELVDWPSSTDVLPVYRATACAISYWTGSAWQALAGNAFAFAIDPATGAGTVVAPALGTSWPVLGAIAIGPRVRIDLTAGVDPADADAVPESIQQFITALVGEMLDNPTLSATQAVQASPLLSRLLDPWRLYT
jgi:uncharacterized phiE125 gp8 family phage protein